MSGIVVPSRAVVEAAMRTMEGIADEAGWDGRPTLVMYARPAELAEHLERDGLAVVPLPVPPQMWADTGANLRTFSMNLAYARHEPQVRGFVDLMVDAGFVAIALCNEIWLAVDMTDEQHESYQRGDIKTLADVPGRIEARQVLVVDLAGTCYWLMRRRGEEPKMVGVYESGHPECPTGRVMAALHLVAMVMKEELGSKRAEAVQPS